MPPKYKYSAFSDKRFGTVSAVACAVPLPVAGRRERSIRCLSLPVCGRRCGRCVDNILMPTFHCKNAMRFSWSGDCLRVFGSDPDLTVPDGGVSSPKRQSARNPHLLRVQLSVPPVFPLILVQTSLSVTCSLAWPRRKVSVCNFISKWRPSPFGCPMLCAIWDYA